MKNNGQMALEYFFFFYIFLYIFAARATKELTADCSHLVPAKSKKQWIS